MAHPQMIRLGWLLLGLLLVGALPAQAGGLNFIESEPLDHTLVSTVGLQGALAVAISPDDERFVYVAGRDALSLWERDLGTGALTFKEAQFEGMGGVDGIEGGGSVAVVLASLGGTHVYVAGKLADAVGVFTGAAGTGALTFVERKKDGDGIGHPPAGSMRSPTALAVSPDGAHVYVTSGQDQTVVVFSRNATTGALTYLTSYASTNDVPPFEGLNHPQGLTLDPLGKFVYVAAHRDIPGGVSDGTVVVFRRDEVPGPTFGELTYVKMARDGQGTPPIQRLNDPISLVVSPDGNHVYVASFGGNAVVAFSRDVVPASPTFGELTFLQAQVDGGTVTGLGNAYGIAIDAPAGNYVYATGRNELALAVFARDAVPASPTFGKLSFVESQIGVENKNAPKYPYQCVAGPNKGATCTVASECPSSSCSGDVVHGLVGPSRLAIAPTTPSGTHLYVPGAFPGSLVAFAVDTCGNGKLGGDEECDDARPVCSSCRLGVCGTAPGVGCGTIHTTTPADASLSIKNDPTKSDDKDSLQWQWKKGTVAAPAYGNPLTTADYVICVYDSSANPQPLASRAAPKGKGWTKTLDSKTATVKEFKYKSTTYRPDGLYEFKLKVSTSAKAQISVKGKNYFLHPPVLAPLVPGPPGLTMPVTVEVRNTENSECWQATYDGIVGVDPKRITKNNETQFKGKSN